MSFRCQNAKERKSGLTKNHSESRAKGKKSPPIAVSDAGVLETIFTPLCFPFCPHTPLVCKLGVWGADFPRDVIVTHTHTSPIPLRSLAVVFRAVTAAHSRRHLRPPPSCDISPGPWWPSAGSPSSFICSVRLQRGGGRRFVVRGPQPFPFHLPDFPAAEPSDSVPLDRPTPQNRRVPPTPNVVFTL